MRKENIFKNNSTHHSGLTLRNGGSVLIPCYPSGVVYDLFECLSTNLDNHGLSQIPMFFISPVADSSLAYSNILAEWLSSMKQNKVYIPDEPFPHASLVKNARLKHFKHIYSEGFSADFRQVRGLYVWKNHPKLNLLNCSPASCSAAIPASDLATPCISSSCGDQIHCTPSSSRVCLLYMRFYYPSELNSVLWIIARTRLPISASVGPIPAISHESDLLSHRDFP